MDNCIEKVKKLMLDVSTQGVDINTVNSEYKELIKQLQDFFDSYGIKNTILFRDLWDFYSYWKEQGMTTYAQRRTYVNKLYRDIEIPKMNLKLGSYSFVSQERITELKNIKTNSFDLCKLIKLCEELNGCFFAQFYLSTAMIVRAIFDHVPPIFNKKSFTEVTNNYGSKSFQDSMKNLHNSSRKISDSHLHTQIRKKEVLPNSNQVDFSNDLDVLLSEICRILK